MQSVMVASQNEADVFRGRPEVQPVTHCHIRSCAVSRLVRSTCVASTTTMIFVSAPVSPQTTPAWTLCASVSPQVRSDTLVPDDDDVAFRYADDNTCCLMNPWKARRSRCAVEVLESVLEGRAARSPDQLRATSAPGDSSLGDCQIGNSR